MENLMLNKIKNLRQFFIGTLLLLLVVIAGLNDKLLSESLIYSKTYPHKKTHIRYLEMYGNVKESKHWELRPLKNIVHAEITILNSENKVVGYTFSDKAGICFIKLPLDNQFIIKVSKKGYVTKTINVDTRLRVKKLKRYKLNYEIELFEDIYGLDVSILKKPIANVRYNNYLSSFDYDFIYTDQVNDKLKNNYFAYYKVHPEKNVLPNKKANNSKRIKYIPSDISKFNSNTNKKNITSDKKRLATGPNNNDRINYKPAIDSFYNSLEANAENFGMNDIAFNGIIDSSDIVFKIQILSIKEYLTPDAKLSKKFGKVNEYIYDGKNQYTIGEFKTFVAASKMLNEINVNGYKDAFLVAFYKGHRINIDKAQSLKYGSK